MALLEQEAIRFAESLDDYEHVSVTDIGGNEPHAFWLVARDHRFGLDYEIASHCGYWEVLSAFVSAVAAPHSGGERATALEGSAGDAGYLVADPPKEEVNVVRALVGEFNDAVDHALRFCFLGPLL